MVYVRITYHHSETDAIRSFERDRFRAVIRKQSKEWHLSFTAFMIKIEFAFANYKKKKIFSFRYPVTVNVLCL